MTTKQVYRNLLVVALTFSLGLLCRSSLTATDFVASITSTAFASAASMSSLPSMLFYSMTEAAEEEDVAQVDDGEDEEEQDEAEDEEETEYEDAEEEEEEENNDNDNDNSNDNDNEGEEAMTTTTKSSSSEKKKMPLFVLHVGLHKTGTTFLQSVFCGKGEEREKVKDVLLQDNFVVLGTGKSRECLVHYLDSFFPKTQGLDKMIQQYPEERHLDDKASLRLSRRFQGMVRETYYQGRNAMVVFEEFSTYTSEQIRVLADFLAPNWHVEILIAYRPMYSWLPSVQSQVIAYHGKDRWYSSDSNRADTRAPLDLDNERGHTTKMFAAMERHGKHPAEMVRDKYVKIFGADRVSIIPQHLFPKKWNNDRGEPLLGHMFCLTLSDASTGELWTPNTCRAVERGEIGGEQQDNNGGGSGGTTTTTTTTNAHSSKDTNPYLLADGAFVRNLIPPNSNRMQVIRAIGEYYRDALRDDQKNSDDSEKNKKKRVHFKCMSKEALARLERVSWEMEMSLFDNYEMNKQGARQAAALRAWAARQDDMDTNFLDILLKDLHRAGFEKAKSQDKKYCHVDVARLLDMQGQEGDDTTEWIQFFHKSWKTFEEEGGQEEGGREEQEEDFEREKDKRSKKAGIPAGSSSNSDRDAPAITGGSSNDNDSIDEAFTTSTTTTRTKPKIMKMMMKKPKKKMNNKIKPNNNAELE